MATGAPSSSPGRLDTLQAGRALAALSVVLFHDRSIILAPKYFAASVWPFLSAGNAGVPFFFVLSGFVMLLAHRRDFGAPSAAVGFAVKRAKRLYPALWITLLLLLPAYLINPTLGGPADRHPATWLAAFLALPAANVGEIIPVEWTLQHEVLFYALFSTAILHRRVGLGLLGLWFALCAVSPFLRLGDVLAFVFSAQHLLFAMGMLVCLAFRERRLPPAASRGLMWSGAALFLTAWAVRVGSEAFSYTAAALLFGGGASLLILGLVNMERNGQVRTHRALVLLGEASYSIYLVHYSVLSAAARLLVRTPLRSMPHCAFLVLLAIAAGAGLLFHLGIERPTLSRLSPRSAFARPAV